jgi:hypothetical protein
VADVHGIERAAEHADALDRVAHRCSVRERSRRSSSEHMTDTFRAYPRGP